MTLRAQPAQLTPHAHTQRSSIDLAAFRSFYGIVNGNRRKLAAQFHIDWETVAKLEEALNLKPDPNLARPPDTMSARELARQLRAQGIHLSHRTLCAYCQRGYFGPLPPPSSDTIGWRIPLSVAGRFIEAKVAAKKGGTNTGQ